MVGDKAIKIVGQAIKKNIREQDLGVRLGGDEFIILLSSNNKRTAKKVIERIRKEISKTSIKEHLNIKISAGAACQDCAANLTDMMKMADKNLYKEKQFKKQKNTKKSDLREEIKKIRDKLNKIVNQNNDEININQKVLEISKQLDELIVKYSKMH